jgi:hypothetical protein
MKTKQLLIIYKLVKEGKITDQEFIDLIDPKDHYSHPTFSTVNTTNINESYD